LPPLLPFQQRARPFRERPEVVISLKHPAPHVLADGLGKGGRAGHPLGVVLPLKFGEVRFPLGVLQLGSPIGLAQVACLE